MKIKSCQERFLRFSQKLMVFSLVLLVDSTGFFKNIFGEQICTPDKIFIHFIGCNMHFYIEIQFSILKWPLQNCNSGWKMEKFHFLIKLYSATYQVNENFIRNSKMLTFLVACTRLYTLPCWSVGPSVGPSVRHIFEIMTF